MCWWDVKPYSITQSIDDLRLSFDFKVDIFDTIKLWPSWLWSWRSSLTRRSLLWLSGWSWLTWWLWLWSWSWWSRSWSIIVFRVVPICLPYSPDPNFNLSSFFAASLSRRRRPVAVKPYAAALTSDECLHIARSAQLIFTFNSPWLSIDDESRQQADQYYHQCSFHRHWSSKCRRSIRMMIKLRGSFEPWPQSRVNCYSDLGCANPVFFLLEYYIESVIKYSNTRLSRTVAVNCGWFRQTVSHFKFVVQQQFGMS